MSLTLAYAACCGGLVLSAIAGTWPFLDAPGREAVIAAAMVAIPLQLAAFVWLRAALKRNHHFLVAWAAGTFLRMGVLLAAGFFLAGSNIPAVPALLALGGFLVGMLLLEPFFLGRDDQRTLESR